jgi:hypothetical protein
MNPLTKGLSIIIRHSGRMSKVFYWSQLLESAMSRFDPDDLLCYHPRRLRERGWDELR